MLSPEETILNVRKAKMGDEKAKEVLIANNTLLIKSIIRRFQNKGIEYDDLYQLGAIGLLKAINNFDESFNVRFSTYAVPMIIGEIKRFLRDEGLIKVSRKIKVQAREVNRFIDEYKNANQREPDVNTIAKALNMEREDIVFALDSSKMPVSLYDSIDDGDDKGCELIDKIASEENEDDLVNKIMIKSFIESLNEREKKIIILRYYKDVTQSEIAKQLGVSQVQVSRIENKIIEKLKQKM